MKTKLLLIFVTTLFLNTTAQETTVNLTMNPGYSDMSYFKLETNTQTNFAANSWDIAFLRVSAFDIDIRSNAHNGIEVLEASNNIADWSSINLADQDNWPLLYNSETDWFGSFSQGSATYGWGEYNPATHHVAGTVIFVLKYANGDYVKFINEDFFNGYTFRYSKWNGSSWDADQTVTIPNANNPDNKYNYFSFQNENEVVAEPAITDWDFVFTKYYIDFFGDGSVYYPVTGVLHNSSTVEVAENIETANDPLPSEISLNFSTDISTIGSDWKEFGGSEFIVDSDKKYYVKYENGTIYRMYFTEFDGSATGNLTFNFEDITDVLDIEDITDTVSFGVYPNPSIDKKINLVYDVASLNKDKNEVIIYTINGVKVYQSTLTNNTGFYNKTLDLSNLESGIYILQFVSGKFNSTKKIVLK